MPNTEQEVVIYKYHASFTAFLTRAAHQWFERDLAKRQKAGWRLVSCTQTGRDLLGKPVLTAIYERSIGMLQHPQ